MEEKKKREFREEKEEGNVEKKGGVFFGKKMTIPRKVER